MPGSNAISGGNATRKLVLGGGGGRSIPTGNAGEYLKSDGTTWASATIAAKDVGAYSTAEVDTKLSSLTLGLIHSAAVVALTDTPPASPTTMTAYIVGKTPTGAWAGQANQLAEWDGAAWTFTAPTQGEAHFSEETNETWHWNGTGWVKVGKAVLNLSDLNDVAAQSPADGNTLEYSNKQWRLVPKPIIGVTHEFHPGIHNAGQHGVLDIGITDWHRLDMEGVIEIQDAPTHLTWTGMDAAGNPVLLVANLQRQLTRLTFGQRGINGRGFYALDNQWHVGSDHFSLTWLAGANGNNDRISHTVGNYLPFHVRVQRMYDDYLIVETSLLYTSYGGEIYKCEHAWAFSPTDANKKLQKMAIVPANGTARLAVNGQFTLH